MGQIANSLNRREEGRLPSQPVKNPKGQYEVEHSQASDSYHEQAKAVITLRSGREVETRPEEDKVKEKSSPNKSKDSGDEKVPKRKKAIPPTSSSPVEPSYSLKAPFPTCLNSPPPFRKKDVNQENMLEVFKQVKINLPLLDAIKQIPSYAKFLKDLCTDKRKARAHLKESVPIPPNVSSILQFDTVQKLPDPGIPTIECVIGEHTIDRALIDLGASVNLLPYSVYE